MPLKTNALSPQHVQTNGRGESRDRVAESYMALLLVDANTRLQLCVNGLWVDSPSTQGQMVPCSFFSPYEVVT